MSTVSRWLAAILIAAFAVSACGGGTSAADGKRIASQSRRSVAVAFWQLYKSLGNGVVTSGGDGRFTQCGSSAGHSVVYAVHMAVAPRQGSQAEGQFLAALAGRLNRAGWRLSQAGGAYHATRHNGVRVAVSPPRLGGSQTAASVMVTGKCTDVGPAAEPIVSAYQDNSDQYRAAQVAAAPVPTGFPSP